MRFAHHIGSKGKKTAIKFWNKISLILRACYFETPDWEAYKSIISPAQRKVGKDLTFYIEGFNATIRAQLQFLLAKSYLVEHQNK